MSVAVSTSVSQENSTHTALVTGGLGGLGEAIARTLHNAGYRVLVSDLPDEHRAAQWLAHQKEQGYHFDFYAADVADFDSVQAMAEQIKGDGHVVDILINNAGITRDATLRKLDKPNWDAVLRTNLDSVFNVTKPFLDGMLERGWGRIVNISSVNGSKGQFGQSNYASAKAGIYGFTKSLALEVARKGITVNSISPGYLATQMVEAIPPEILEKQIIASIPVGKLGKPEDVAALVAFVVSDAGAYMTGSNLAINGGLHMY